MAVCRCFKFSKSYTKGNTSTYKHFEAVVFPAWLLQETCPYLSTSALSRECRSTDGQQQQEGFTKLLLDS